MRRKIQQEQRNSNDSEKPNSKEEKLKNLDSHDRLMLGRYVALIKNPSKTPSEQRSYITYRLRLETI